MYIPTTFKHKKQKHLKPLSKYARMMCNDLVSCASICHFLKSPNDFKIDVTEVEAADGGPVAVSSKWPPCLLTLPSDVGCLVGSPLVRTEPVTSKGSRSVGSLLDEVNPPRSSKCDVQSVVPAFDLDVDDLLNLSPCGDGYKTEPVAPLQASPRKDGQCSAKALGLSARTVKEEDGGSSSDHADDPAESRDLSLWADPRPPPASNTQRHLDCQLVVEEFQIEGTASRQRLSFLGAHLEILLGEPRSEPAGWPREVPQSPAEDLWNVGLPALPSSSCHRRTVNLIDSVSRRERVSEGVMELLHEGGGESALDTSYETESPLQVKVKSVLVCISQHSSSSKVAKVLPSTQRKVTIDKVTQGEKKLDTYLMSVKQHLKAPEANRGVMTELSNLMSHVAEQTSGASGPQWQHPSDLTRRYAVPVLSACIVRRFSNRKPLLTGRNYQRRFGNSNPSVSLREWQASSSKAGKRFETVPRTFRTSPVD